MINVRNWDFVWSLRLPSKIKKFAWRLLKGALPDFVSLKHRNMDVVLNFPVWDCGDETILHVFRDCHFARIVWALSPLSQMLLSTDF